MGLEKRDQPAGSQYLARRGGERRHFADEAAGRHRDPAFGQVDLDGVAVLDTRQHALDAGQAVVDAIAEELPPEGRRHDARYAHQVQYVHGLLARRVVAEILPRDDHVAFREAGGETRRKLLEGVLRDVSVVPARMVLARAMQVGVDVVAQQPGAPLDELHAAASEDKCAGRQSPPATSRTSAMCPVSAEAATVADDPM